MKGKFKQTKGCHLTALDRKLITTCIENNMQDVSTKYKRFNVISSDSEGNHKAVLHSFEVGIGYGSKKRWVSRNVEFKTQ